MRRLIFSVLGILSIVFAASALEAVNGRELPDSTDFTSSGNSTMRAMQHINDVVGKLAAILPSTEGADAINVDSATITTATIATLNTTGVSTIQMKYDSVLTNTDGSETVTAAQTGSLLVATKSDGATTFTLPDPSAATVGCVWTFIQTANQNLVVTSATADNNAFVADAVATSDQVSCATASHLIGSGIVVIGISATQYFATERNAECPLTVEAAD